jgi:ketosteroid isomerase-like protein
MGELTDNAVRDIERIHSDWIAFEIAGENYRLAELCDEDIEFWPPDRAPVRGLRSVSALFFAPGESRIHSIDITDRRIRGSGEIAYLTANYTTRFSVPSDVSVKSVIGSHLWILRRRASAWCVALVAWSVWGAERAPEM